MIWSRSPSEYTRAKMSAPSTPRQMRQRPKMTSARHTQPRPAMMSRVKRAEHRERQERAADGHQRASRSSAPRSASRATLMPAASAASGFSPTARTASPNGVRPSSHQAAGATTQERDVGQAVLLGHDARIAQEPERVPLLHGRRCAWLSAPVSSSRLANSDRPMSAIVSPGRTRAGWRPGSRSAAP